MDSSREAKNEEEKREDEATSLVDVNLLVVLLSQLCTENEDDKNLEKERRDHVVHETRQSRARANMRFLKETKMMEKRAHVLQPMAKEFRHSRRM